MVITPLSFYRHIEGANVCLLVCKHVWVFACVYTLSVVENVNVSVFGCTCVYGYGFLRVYLYCSLYAWSVLAVGEARKRDVMAQIARRMQHKCGNKALGRWCENVDELRRMAHVMQTVVRRMSHASLSSALGRWRESVCENKTMLAKCNKVVMRWKNQSAARRCVRVYTCKSVSTLMI